MKLRRRDRDITIDWWHHQGLKTVIEDALFPMMAVLGNHYSMSVAFVQSGVDKLKPKDMELATKCAHMMVEEWMRTRAEDIGEMNRLTTPQRLVITDADAVAGDGGGRFHGGGISIPVTEDGSQVVLPPAQEAWTPLK